MKKKILTLTLFMLAFVLTGVCQDPVIVTVSQPSLLLADAGSDHQVNRGESVVLGGNPSASHGYGGYLYLWSPAIGLDNATLANPSASPGETTTYILTVTDANNCSSVDEVTVSVNASAIEILPAGFTIRCYPNPVNDELMIEMEGIASDLNIRLVNQLGEELLSKTCHVSGTSATERIAMAHHPAGVYYLRVIFEDKAIFQPIFKVR